jgi:UDP-N-acetylmuramoylalanine--D-glutamate ligase
MDFSKKHILVLGLGLHGGAIGTIEWFAKEGANIMVSDNKAKEQLASSIEKLNGIPNLTFHFGNQDEIDLDGIDMVVRNPAIPRRAPILERARTLGIPVEMDSSLFFEYCPSKDVIGITGSKGKTTTSATIAHVVGELNRKTVAVGIDGVSPLGMLGEITPLSPVIFEISSWRLEALQDKHVSPHIAVATSIYKDHLNTYTSFEEYIDVKKQIIKDQTSDDIAILNGDDEKIRGWEQDVKGQLYWYSLNPLSEGEQGIWVDNGHIHTTVGEFTCTTSSVPHTSLHELRNKLPAILITLLREYSKEDILAALQSMPPLAHRLQTVREVRGVKYINDSAATMPDAAIAALETYADIPLILILGGSDKALEFQDLAQKISQSKNIKHLIWLPGTATERMKQEILPHTSTPSNNAATMDDAVMQAYQHATPGDTVLLSPGATSFGLFLHEFDRGNAFIRTVEKL